MPVCVCEYRRACVCVCVSVNESCDRFYWCISNKCSGRRQSWQLQLCTIQAWLFSPLWFQFCTRYTPPSFSSGGTVVFPLLGNYHLGNLTNSLDAPPTHSGASLSGSLKIQQKSGFKMGVPYRKVVLKWGGSLQKSSFKMGVFLGKGFIDRQ